MDCKQVQSSPVASIRGRMVIPAAYGVASELHGCLISSDQALTACSFCTMDLTFQEAFLNAALENVA